MPGLTLRTFLKAVAELPEAALDQTLVVPARRAKAQHVATCCGSRNVTWAEINRIWHYGSSESQNDCLMVLETESEPEEAETVSQREREIIECLFNGWVQSENMGLYGGLSYQCVIDLMAKLGIDPQPLKDRVDSLQRMADEAAGH